jgi:NADH-quinone oxidoreductase subunit C
LITFTRYRMSMSEETTQPAAAEETATETAIPALTALVQAQFSGAVQSHHHQHGDETLVISRDQALEIFRFLRDDPRCQFELMIDLTAVDHLPWEPRFEVVVHLKSLALGHRLRVKILLGADDPSMDSIADLWSAANWYERECWDMYGITFNGHPKLKRLLMYEGFVGFPLRKDYEKTLAQPLVPMRPVRERYDYGEEYTATVTRQDAPGFFESDADAKPTE